MAEARKRILVVDDDPEIRDSLQVILESGGYEVQSAASGMEGLRCLQGPKAGSGPPGPDDGGNRFRDEPGAGLARARRDGAHLHPQLNRRLAEPGYELPRSGPHWDPAKADRAGPSAVLGGCELRKRLKMPGRGC